MSHGARPPNAGSGRVGTLELDGVAVAREVMKVNFFGVLAVSGAAMPHLRDAGGRPVTVSSVGGVVGQPFNEAYCAAKFAVEGYTESPHPVAARMGVRVSVVEPGAAASEFTRSVGVGGDLEKRAAQAGPYVDAMQAHLARTAGAFAGAQSAAGAAAVVAGADLGRCACVRRPEARRSRRRRRHRADRGVADLTAAPGRRPRLPVLLSEGPATIGACSTSW